MDNLTDQFKQGYKTSEFWVSMLAIVLAAVAAVLRIAGVEVDDEELAAALTPVITAIFYVLGRSWLKTKRVTAAGRLAEMAEVVDKPTTAGIQERYPPAPAAGEPTPAPGAEDGG